jgi:enamine deaminase RidA (YjgF/YER057c/UK114 family)
VSGPHEIVNPTALGRPSGFSHALVSTGGRIVWLAGQTALGPGGRIVAPGDIVAQYDRALANLITALEAAGAQPADLVSVTTYIVNVDHYRQRSGPIGDVWRLRVGRHYPAMAAVGVSRLWDADALVEIQGVAVVPNPVETIR